MGAGRRTREEVAAARREQEWPRLVVSVTVLRGRDLVSMDRNGQSDPFVKLYCGREKFKTGVVKKSLAPVWGVGGGGETHEFTLRRRDLEQEPREGAGPDTSLLRCEVWDWDRVGNDPMGCCELGRAELSAMRGRERWLPLQPMKGMGEEHATEGAELGELQLRCTLTVPPGPPAPAPAPAPAGGQGRVLAAAAMQVHRRGQGSALNPTSAWIRIALDGRAFFVDSASAPHRYRMMYSPRGGGRRSECGGRCTQEEPQEGVREVWDPFSNRQFFEQEWAFLTGTHFALMIVKIETTITKDLEMVYCGFQDKKAHWLRSRLPVLRNRPTTHPDNMCQICLHDHLYSLGTHSLPRGFVSDLPG
jgi:hypothetical protein